MKNSAAIFILFLSIILTGSSCKKEKDPELPEIQFKEGPGYISSNSTLGKNNQITVGITAKKNQASLRSFMVYQSYDNSTYQQVFIYTLAINESNFFSKDYDIITRDESGTEKYKFTVADSEGNTAFKELTIKVQ
ncbi:MAG: hypothetical protein LC117_05910 [Bacteroidia bacterium]|nr:hypothetical protein [Bacteroidia bacterium]MCZ2277445.1 hypothetical protein [Bacteroidia bacterium]